MAQAEWHKQLPAAINTHLTKLVPDGSSRTAISTRAASLICHHKLFDPQPLVVEVQWRFSVANKNMTKQAGADIPVVSFWVEYNVDNACVNHSEPNAWQPPHLGLEVTSAGGA